MKQTLFFFCCLLCIPMAGCAWMGQTAGKAQAKVERKAHDLEEGYHKGYEDEKAKSAPKQDAPERNVPDPEASPQT